MLHVSDLAVAYDGVPALHGVDLTVGDGEYVSLLGPNGAGKTTLLKTISGTADPIGGTVALDDEDVLAASPPARVDLGIVHVPQGRRVFADLTVRDNLVLGAFRPAARRRAEEHLTFVLELFPPLRERLDGAAGGLSGGQQQMLAVGRGLMACPSLLMLDEPSMGLAPVVIDAIFDALEEIRAREAMSVLLVEQHADRAIRACDRAYVLESGAIALSGTSKELLGDARLLEAYLGAA